MDRFLKRLTKRLTWDDARPDMAILKDRFFKNLSKCQFFSYFFTMFLVLHKKRMLRALIRSAFMICLWINKKNISFLFISPQHVFVSYFSIKTCCGFSLKVFL